MDIHRYEDDMEKFYAIIISRLPIFELSSGGPKSHVIDVMFTFLINLDHAQSSEKAAQQSAEKAVCSQKAAQQPSDSLRRSALLRPV